MRSYLFIPSEIGVFEKILIEYGYNSQIDGIWGSGTKKSLKKYVTDSIGKEIFNKITINEFKKYLLSKI